MSFRSIRDADVAGKRVLVRVDFNVPLQDGKITDDTRIRASLPTIQDLTTRGARVILMSHLGRPKGKPNPEFSLAPAARRLEDLLGHAVSFASDVAGESAQSTVGTLQKGQVALLENVRFEPGEEKNDPELSRRLASLGDLFVNDAFGSAHRAHSSTVGVAELLPSYAGYLLEAELNALGKIATTPEHPYVAIIGGAKVSDKIAVLDNLVKQVDTIVIGGGMANTFLLAEGKPVGNSLAEPDFLDQARKVVATAKERGGNVLLPTDVIVATAIDASEGTVKSVADVAEADAIFDIGPETAARYADAIAGAKTIFWNGPMGVFERQPFAEGTLAVANAVAASPAFSVVGGGDSVAAIEQAGVADKISHISTGGGASLEFIEGRMLPGVAALEAGTKG
jgi:phosphoglycerate kinase